MDADALNTFLTVYRERSFSSAARILNRTQPAISSRINLLERELGMPLFERMSGGIALSQAGRVLLPFAERALAALQDAEAAVMALKSEEKGPLSLAVVGTLASTDLATVLKHFVRDHPGVDLRLQTVRSNEVSDLVRRGEATIGIRYDKDRSSDLHYEPVTRERLVVVSSIDNASARGARSLADLAHQRWIGFPEIPGQRETWASHISSIFQSRGFNDLDWLPVDSLTAQKRLVEAGFGLALMMKSGVMEELANGSLAVIDINDLAPTIPVYSVIRENGFLSAAARRLLELVRTDFLIE